MHESLVSLVPTLTLSAFFCRRYSLPPSVLGYLSSYMSILHLSSLTFLLPLLPKDIPLLPVFSSILLATIYFFDTTLYPDHPSPVLYLLLLQPLYTSLYLLGKINASSSSLKATKSPATLLTVLDFGQNVIGIVVPIARVTILKALDAVDDEDKQMRLWSYVASATVSEPRSRSYCTRATLLLTHNHSG